jgi:hypothetical protein
VSLAASCQFPRYELEDDSGSQAGEGSGGGSGGNDSIAGATSSGNGGVAGGGAQAGAGGSVVPAAGSGHDAGAPAGGAGEPAEGGAGGAPPEPQPEGLAQARSATASSKQSGNEVAHGNDGVPATRWCADNDSLPQWWRVDLGSERLLTSFSVHWEHGDRAYSYLIETSSDDALFTTRVSNTATGLLQTADFPANTHARYVRITVTGAAPAGWASFYEFSLLGF